MNFSVALAFCFFEPGLPAATFSINHALVLRHFLAPHQADLAFVGRQSNLRVDHVHAGRQPGALQIHLGGFLRLNRYRRLHERSGKQRYSAEKRKFLFKTNQKPMCIGQHK